MKVLEQTEGAVSDDAEAVLERNKERGRTEERGHSVGEPEDQGKPLGGGGVDREVFVREGRRGPGAEGIASAKALWQG